MVPEEYASFLMRCWREQATSAQQGLWCGEIEHIQSGSRWRFSTMSELLTFLQQVAGAPTGTVQSESKGEQC